MERYSCSKCKNSGNKEEHCYNCVTAADDPNGMPSEFEPRQSIDECTVEQWDNAKAGAFIKVDNVRKYIEQSQQAKVECPDYQFSRTFISLLMDYLQEQPYKDVCHLMQELERAYVQMRE